MPRKFLFDENDRYTDAANAIDGQINQVVRPIIEAWYVHGYSARDIQVIAQNAILDIVLNLIIQPRADLIINISEAPNGPKRS